MLKKGDRLDLYGKSFIIVNGKGVPRKRCDGLYDAYKNPSTTKGNIWQSWIEWFRLVLRDNNGGEIYITSYNQQFFSIGGYIESPLDETWAFLITSTRHELWQVR